MKVLFLTQYPREGPSSRFRVYQYIEGLQAEGITCSVQPLVPSSLYRSLYLERRSPRRYFLQAAIAVIKRLSLLPLARYYDIAFVQKWPLPFASAAFVKALRRMNENIIFDFDDTIYLDREEEVGEIIRVAKLTVVGNNYLRDFAEKYTKNVAVIPTPVDTQYYSPKRVLDQPIRNKDTVIIGWIGTKQHVRYVEGLEAVFKSLSKIYPIHVKVVSNDRPKFKTFANYTFKAWKYEEEICDLASFDIGIMPLEDNKVTRGKCALKLLQYMALGLASVASPVGVNTEIIQDGENGFLAETQEEWTEKLGMLIADRALRQRLGKAGRNTVETLYSLDKMIPRLKAIFEQVQGDK